MQDLPDTMKTVDLLGAPQRRPRARIEIARDTYFGETLEDPYRWMENEDDADWLPFLEGQDAYTRSLLEALPHHATLLARIRELTADTVATADVQRAGGRTFFEQRPRGVERYQLYVQDAGGTRLLVDPEAIEPGSNLAVDWWVASPDGRHLVFGLSEDGSEDSVLHVLQVDDAKLLAERIADAQMAMPEWLPDGSGFFYNQLTGLPGTPERYLDSRAMLHRLGTDPRDDRLVMQRGHDATVDYDRIQAPYVMCFQGSPWVVLQLGDVRPETRCFVARLDDVLAGRATWREFAGFADEVTAVDACGDELYALANRGFPRGRLLRLSAAEPDLAAATEVVPESASVLDDIARAGDGLYLLYMDGGLTRLRRLAADGRVTDVVLPDEANVAALFAAPEEDGVLLALSGWLTPEGIWSLGPDGSLRDTGITPRPALDVSAFTTTRFEATAADGTRIPVSLVHRRDLSCDGSAPAYVCAYGAYGVAAYTPHFAARNLALLEAGVVLGYAHVRGGGEFGRAWHEAGRHERKPNTWRDLIAACEALCAAGYTSPARLAIGGRSAGGIAVGRAMTERPDLFAAVVSGVGWSNPLRYVVEENSFSEEPEWGAIGEPDGYRWLRSIDSYHAVQEGTAYPAVLLTTGITDPRVAPFHVAKMAARLQQASSSPRPVLLRVDFDAGHGMGSTRAQQDLETADTFAFLLWQLAGLAGR
jgi:prolyl oligopeptidase